jgi:hypothetical protein
MTHKERLEQAAAHLRAAADLLWPLYKVDRVSAAGTLTMRLHSIAKDLALTAAKI